MRIVVSDTGPLNYLTLIEAIDLFPRLFGRVFAPAIIGDELRHARAPAVVRDWLAARPAWFELVETPPLATLLLPALDPGERAAIALAHSLRADLVLMDDRAGVAAARAEGFAVAGTLGVLDLAARRGLTDLAAMLARLQATNFRCRRETMDALLAQFEAERKGGRGSLGSQETKRSHPPLNRASRFSTNAAIPSRWSAVPYSAWNRRRSKRTPSASPISSARLTASLAAIVASRP